MSQQYKDPYNQRVAFPLGGIGAGMLCLEGTGALSHFSVHNKPNVNAEPMVFSALYLKDREETRSRVLEGPVPAWKTLGVKSAHWRESPAVGLPGRHYGLPRFSKASFTGKFPFGTVELEEEGLPVKVRLTGWSPFVPGQADDSSLPVAGLEYRFKNESSRPVELVYSFHAFHFMAVAGANTHRVERTEQGRGFILTQPPVEGRRGEHGDFAVHTDHPEARIDCAWFRGGGFDPLTMVWNSIASGACKERPPHPSGGTSPGGSLYVPMKLEPGGQQTVRLQLAWYVPETALNESTPSTADPTEFHRPWYAGAFGDSRRLFAYWFEHYDRLRLESERFSSAFFGTTAPEELVQAAAANLSILKSPTVLRQTDGRLWGWEGCADERGCGSGSCTHVWNYAQSIPHLFPSLERTLRETAFGEGQDERGHQQFRVPLPIRPAAHDFHAASDGQLGEVMKVFREWRISGNTGWMLSLWPRVKRCLTYCTDTWDPDRLGVLIEPHHNTYDIEFWGPDGMCSSVYLGALKAAAIMAQAAGEPESAVAYETLYNKGKRYLEEELFNGEYFEQRILWEGLRNKFDEDGTFQSYSPEALELLQAEGPKYQYGQGCLSDGVVGAWFALMCGLGEILDRQMVRSHLLSVYRHNYKASLADHANPQRPGYALGYEGGLLLCTWPRGGRLALPFAYSNEVWTGIEYQVASHLLSLGCTEEALDIVRTCRARYAGDIRNPYDEYEFGHWYARAMASYGLLQGWSGLRYDAVDQALYMKHSEDDYSGFLATEGGYGIGGFRNGQPYFEVRSGRIGIARILIEDAAAVRPDGGR